MNYFSVNYLEGAIEFLKSLESKTKEKVLSNAQKATLTNDPKLFKKLDGNIWELRTNHNGLQIRLLAFWDKTDFRNTLVVATHGFVKKKARSIEVRLKKQRKSEINILETQHD